MLIDNLQKRLREILDFIWEITIGNYTYTLSLRGEKDELEQMVLSLNTMAEEVDTAVHQINHEKSREVIENVTFNLDHKLRVTSYSVNVAEILKYSKTELMNMQVKLLLSEDTKIPSDLPENGKKRDFPFKVEFRHRSGFFWVGKAWLHRLESNGNDKYTLSVFKAVYYNEMLRKELQDKKPGPKYPSENRSLHLRDQRMLIRKLHKYVMERLDQKLENISVIARVVGASTSKIKTIFKHTYGDTIYNYHRIKRLEKASMLLKHTSLPINEIAEECGFIEFSHFSRSFKKEYGVTPTQIRNS